MLRQVISRIATCPRTLVTSSKLVPCRGNFGTCLQSRISSSTLLLNSPLHTGCFIKPEILKRSVSTSLVGLPSLPLKSQPSLFLNVPSTSAVQTRSVTKWSLQKGKRKTVKAVVIRFKRLPWAGRGIWIRPRAGASKRMWKKNRKRKYRAKTHVFCNATQSHMLDKMVTRFWKKPRHYPDDPYRPYMRRENFGKTTPYPREYF